MTLEWWVDTREDFYRPDRSRSAAPRERLDSEPGDPSRRVAYEPEERPEQDDGPPVFCLEGRNIGHTTRYDSHERVVRSLCGLLLAWQCRSSGPWGPAEWDARPGEYATAGEYGVSLCAVCARVAAPPTVGAAPVTDIKRIDIREFRERGYLQEVNRQFLHPLGLALEVVIEDDGTERLGGVWDYRDDPEGMRFAVGVLDDEHAERIVVEWGAKASVRWQTLGYVIQPVAGES